MKYTWLSGPSAVRRINAGADTIERGGEVELTDAQYAHYAGRGFVFDPADRRRKPPVVEEEEVTPETEATEG